MNATPEDDSSVQKVNRLANSRGLDGAEELGRFVLDTYFQGSPERFRREGKGNPAFRLLVDSPKLAASYSLLYYSVAVTEQLDQLPAEVGRALSFSHHKLLLPVKDPRTKEAFARKALSDELSVRGLRDLVATHRQRQRTKVRRGRPPLPDFVKSLHRLPKIVSGVRATELDSEHLFDRYSPEQAQALLKRTRKDLARLERMLSRLEERIEAATT